MESEAPVQKKLNLKRLDEVLRYLQIGSVVTLVIFVVLIALSLRKLAKVNFDIKEQENQSKNLKASIKTQRNALDNYHKIRCNSGDPLEIDQSISLPESVSKAVPIPARIYMQIGSEDQREYAAGTSSLLQDKGYIVPGVENVHDKAPPESELRYYSNDKATMDDVEDIIQKCKVVGLILKKAKVSSSGVRPRHYEIWLGKNLGSHPQLD